MSEEQRKIARELRRINALAFGKMLKNLDPMLFEMAGLNEFPWSETPKPKKSVALKIGAEQPI